MAEILLFKLNDLIVKEVDLISRVEEQVELLDGDLRMMYAVLQDVEASEGPSDFLQRWNELIETANLNADNAIEKFVTSPRNKNFFHRLINRYEIGRQLKRIESNIHQISMLKNLADKADDLTADNSIPHFISFDNPLLFLRQLTINEAYYLSKTILPIASNSLISYILTNVCRVLRSLILGDQDLWKLTRDRVQLIQGDLSFIQPFFEYVNGMEGLSEREKIWVLEMKDIADHVKALADVALKHLQERKNVINSVLSRSQVDEEIEAIENKISNMRRIMQIYEIDVSEGNRGQKVVALSQDYQEKQPSIGGEESSCSSMTQNPGLTGVATWIQEEEKDHIGNGSISTILKKFPHPLLKRKSSNLENQVKKTEIEVKLMRASLVDFQALEKPSRRLKVWLEQIGGIADDAHIAIDAYYRRKQNDQLYYMDIVFLEKMTNDMKRITNRIHDVSERRDASNSIFHSLCHRPPANIIGFDDDVRAVKSQLLQGDDSCSIISITGEQGTGKTTLAKFIYSDNEVSDHFPSRAWVSVPQENSDSAVVREIRKQLMSSLQSNGTQEPLIDERCLIILEDIRTTKVLDDVRIAFPYQLNTSRIIATAREMPTDFHADSSVFCHKIQLLSDEESWKLFTTTYKAEIPSELEELAKGIVRNCGRVPRNIVNMGNLLSREDASRETWSMLLKQFNKGQITWPQTEKAYMELPRNLRKCLHYFRLFPRDFPIPARRLLTLWVAEGFVNKRMGDEPPEHIATRYLKELIDRKLVEVVKKKFDGDVEKCRLSEEGDKFLRDYDVASSGTSSIPRFADHYNAGDSHFQHIHGSDDLSSLKEHYKDVLSFLSFDHRKGSEPGEDVGRFLQRCISSRCFLSLRVLDLERVFRPKFPKASEKLLQLRYLGLRWTYLEELPEFVRSLLKLQTLDLKHTYISTLPHSIWKMQRLRHLYLSESYRSRFKPKPGRSSLMELQTLWGAFIDEESPVKNGLDAVKNLRKLGLALRAMLSQKKKMLSQIGAVADWILTLEHLETLRLRSFDEHGLAWYLPMKNLSKLENLSAIYLFGRLKLDFVKSGIPKGLVYLTLAASGLKKDAMRVLEYLDNLKMLKLFSDSFVGKSMFCSSEMFPHLQVLKLWGLKNLETWDMEEGALPQLTDLEIRSCRQLKMLPKEIQFMRHLKVLKLTGLRFRKILYCSSGSYPRLSELKLENLEFLQLWIVGKGAFPQLRDLEIRSCRQLKMLPKELQNMKNLEVFEVSDMPQEFISRIAKNQGLDWFKIAHVPTRKIVSHSHQCPECSG